MLAKLNKIPYLLWLNKDVEVELNHENKVAKLLGGKTEFTPVKEWVIILIKHVPIILVALFLMADLDMIYYIENYLVFLIVLGFVLGSFFLFGYKKVLFMPFILLGSVGIWYGMLNGYSMDMDYSFAISIQLSVILMVIYDIYKLGNGEKYYYLDEASKEISKEFKIKKNVKRLSFMIGGMFIKVVSNDK